ncbi:conserved hypothetical protein [delta proteobacterium NaphS2]|nr:conserved hypothetical protein [delta proteobacterium NaphS2]
MAEGTSERFCGYHVSDREIDDIREIVSSCNGISRTELANTVCELFEWKRPTGKLKTVECRQFLEDLHNKGIISLPERRAGRPAQVRAKVKRTENAKRSKEISGPVKQFLPLSLIRIETKAQRDLWCEYVDRYHYLGYRTPFGAQLRYFVESRNERRLGCLQFSSPGWKMAARDKWIGWNDTMRKRNLQMVVNNSRFLIFPWVRVKNLASSILALAIRKIPDDWEKQYGIRPVILETLVDQSRYTGTCYKASNWIHVGTTAGRGRMDRHHARHGQSPKEIYVYPLTSRFREELRG